MRLVDGHGQLRRDGHAARYGTEGYDLRADGWRSNRLTRGVTASGEREDDAGNGQHIQQLAASPVRPRQQQERT